MADSLEKLEQILATIMGSAKQAMESGAKVKGAFGKSIEDLITRLKERLEWLEFLLEVTLGRDPRRYEYTTHAPLIVSGLDLLLLRTSREPVLDITRDETLSELQAYEKQVSWMLGLLGLLFLHSTGMPLPSRESGGERLDDISFLLSCLGVDEVLTADGRIEVKLLLKVFIEGTVPHKLIAVMALGGIVAQQSLKVEQSVEAGVVAVFGKILIEGPMVVGAEVAYAISKSVEIDPRLRDKLALHDLIGSLVNLLQVDAVEEHSQDDINRATSVLSVVIARHNSNRRKVDDDRSEKSMSSKQIQLPRGTLPNVTTRARAMAVKALRVLATDNAAVCWIIVQKNALLCFGVLLQDRNLDVKLSSAEALMEITMVAEKDTDLRRSAFMRNSHAYKTFVHQLIRITEESVSSPELLVPCIRAIGNLAITFRETRPVIPLVRLLGPGNYEVWEETLIALTKFACRENFLHSDHSKAILGLPEVDRLVYLARGPSLVYLADGTPFCFQGEVQKLALVLLCYIALDAHVSLSDKRKEVVSAIKLASREVRFSKDENEQAQLVKEAKRRLC